MASGIVSIALCSGLDGICKPLFSAMVFVFIQSLRGISSIVARTVTVPVCCHGSIAISAPSMNLPFGECLRSPLCVQKALDWNGFIFID